MEFTLKPGKKVELLKKVKEEILPILKKYNGFFREVRPGRPLVCPIKKPPVVEDWQAELSGANRWRSLETPVARSRVANRAFTWALPRCGRGSLQAIGQPINPRHFGSCMCFISETQADRYPYRNHQKPCRKLGIQPDVMRVRRTS